MTERQAAPSEQPNDFVPELVIGIVAPSGTRRDRLMETISDRLAYYSYRVEVVRISTYLEEVAGLTSDDKAKPDRRTPLLQDTGSELRRAAGRSDILGFVAAGLVRRARERMNRSAPDDAEAETAVLAAANSQVPGLAYIIWSLKHPMEVAALRGIYGNRFTMFSISSPTELRVQWLADDIARGHRRSRGSEEYVNDARTIVSRDENEPSFEHYGQNVRGAYPLGDFFIDAGDDYRLNESIERSIDIMFGHPYETPTRDELGMYIAHAAALRSAEMGRQVGACLMSNSGSLIATGTNEVPAVGGGHYWREPLAPPSTDDNREFRQGEDRSDSIKRRLATEIYDAFSEHRWLRDDINPTDGEIYESLKRTGLPDLTEYGRAVHAELSAIIDAASRGVSTSGSTMYVTTFPCHHCARHVVGAGIDRLVYIDPYPKSRALELHGDSIAGPGMPHLSPGRVRFESFLGVAPRQYISAFTMAIRKDPSSGRSLPVDDSSRVPRLYGESPYGELDVAAHIQREQQAVAQSAGWIQAAEVAIKAEEASDGRDH